MPKKTKFDQLQMSSNALLNWIMGRRSVVVHSEPVWQLDIFRRQIKSVLDIYPQQSVSRTVRLPAFLPPSGRLYQPIRQLVKGFKQLDDYLYSVVIHGSMATREVVKNWSDVDILCIIKDSVLDSGEEFSYLRHRLQALEEYVYQFDPWQHHGFQVITASDLRYYPEVWLPLEVLQHSRSLLGPRNLHFALRDSRKEKEERFSGWLATFVRAAASRVLQHHGRNGIYLQNDFRNARQAFYQFKYFMSVVLLVPSLFIELVDRPIYKKDSFTIIRDYFTDKQLELLDCCQAGRRLLPDLNIRNNAIPKALQATIGRHYFERARDLMQLMVTQL